MKLSQIKGERVFDVIADLIEPISAIASDKEVAKLFKRAACPKDMTPSAFMAERIRKAAPGLLSRHKDDLVAVFATLNGTTKEEYLEGMTLASFFGDLLELLTDEELLAFLS